MGEPIIRIKGEVSVPYQWACGNLVSKFFINLKDKKLSGSVCKNCKKVMVPPQIVCGPCFSDVEDELIEVSNIGKIETYTVVDFTYPGQIIEPPYAVAIIKLEGTNTRFNHLINKESLGKLKIGSKVQAVWNEEREGSFFDIKYFEVID